MANKKKNSFLLFLIAYILFFVFAALVTVRYFYPIFLEYENNLPKTIANEYATSFDEDKLRVLSADFLATLDTEIETTEESFSELRKIFAEGVTCRRVSSEARDNSCEYSILVSGKKIGTLYLETQDEKLGGFAEWVRPRHWYVVREELEDFSGLIRTESVTVPEGITVTFGGKTLNDNNTDAEKKEITSLKKLYSTYSGLPYVTTYTVTGFLAEHQFSFFDASGNAVNFSGTLEDAENYATDNCTETEKKELAAFCDDFIHRFTQFNSNDGNGFYSNLLYLRELLVPGTAYDNNLELAKASLEYTRPHNNRIDGITMNSYMRIDESAILVGFSYLYSEQEDDGTRYQSTSDVTLYIRQTGTGYLVESCLTGPAMKVN